MSKDARFWRNVTLIALAHVALIAGLIRWSVEARAPNAQSIVWLGDVGGASTATEPTTGEPPPAKLSPSPPTLPKTEEAEKEDPPLPATKSDIESSTPTPIPTATRKQSAPATPKAPPPTKPTP